MIASHAWIIVAFLSGILLVVMVIGAFVLARGYESARQRELRHALKNNLAACRLLLEHHNIPFPDESSED